jgi:hypothetical protein
MASDVPASTGSLWTDAPGAAAVIDAAEATGRLTDRQAAMLRSWRQDGFLVLDRLAPRDRLDPAALDLERCSAGAFPNLRFDCPALSGDPIPWQAAIAPNPASVLDLHEASAAVRNLMLGDPLAEFLKLLLQARTRLIASRGFLRPPVGDCRPDTAGCLLIWIALEYDGGPLLPTRRLALNRGQVAILHPSLPCRGIGVPPLQTRRGLIAWACGDASAG